MRRTRAAKPSGAAPPIEGECADIAREVMMLRSSPNHHVAISLFELFFCPRRTTDR